MNDTIPQKVLLRKTGGEKKMKLKSAALKTLCFGLAGAVAAVSSFAILRSEEASGFLGRVSIASASFLAPEGGAALLQSFGRGQAPEEEEPAVPSEEAPQATAPASEPGQQAQQTQGQTSQLAIKAEDIPEERRGIVKEYAISNKGSAMSLGSVFVKNLTKEHTFDIAEELSRKPGVALKETKEPQVLIMHTHTTECYAPASLGVYDKSWATRTLDNGQNVVAVGNKIAEELEKAGIGVIHDATVHDNPSYTGAYDRSRETVQKILKEHPGIQVVLDIHRDAITGDDGVKVKPTVEIAGKKAAQIMIITGCEEGKVTNYPDWEVNLRLGLRLQKTIAEDYPGLARPYDFAVKHYNQDLTHGSMLIEMGSEANTLEEAMYSGELVGKSLGKLLNSLKE